MAKVFLGVGHGGKDPGAVGYIVEKDGALVIATACKDYLIANGVDVLMSRYVDETESLNEKIRECNAYKPDYAADIHLNAGKGDGAETFHSINYGAGKILAQNILDEICALGQQSRGIKTKMNAQGRDYFAFIRETNCPAVITEAFFVDNAEDVQIGDTIEEQQEMGQAIARGFLKTLGIASNNKPVEKPIQTQYTYEDFVGEVQECIGAKVDRKAGPETLSKTPTISRYKNKNHPVVRPVQKYLYSLGYEEVGVADCDAGPKFDKAMKHYQKDHGCVVDGEATARDKTWKKLLKLA